MELFESAHESGWVQGGFKITAAIPICKALRKVGAFGDTPAAEQRKEAAVAAGRFILNPTVPAWKEFEPDFFGQTILRLGGSENRNT